jgi:hypothetical protein
MYKMKLVINPPHCLKMLLDQRLAVGGCDVDVGQARHVAAHVDGIRSLGKRETSIRSSERWPPQAFRAQSAPAVRSLVRTINDDHE